MRTVLATIALLFLLACSQSDAGRYSEDQRLDGPFRITTEWQTIPLKELLELNHDTRQRLHLAVDRALYIANAEHDLDDKANHFNLRRSDGTLVIPEVILTTETGEQLPLRAVANIYLYAGKMTIGFDAGKERDLRRISPYPQHIKAFTAIRIRSNEPLTVEYVHWRVDRPLRPR